jgi:Mitochondrial carrier protein
LSVFRWRRGAIRRPSAPRHSSTHQHSAPSIVTGRIRIQKWSRSFSSFQSLHEESFLAYSRWYYLNEIVVDLIKMDGGDKKSEPSFLLSLVCGGIAGTTVDVALFPLDTIKTRLQSPQGFLKAGGFRGVYKGLSAAAAGSAPGAALFFSTYEMSKQALVRDGSLPKPAQHMAAASVGEVVSYICSWLHFFDIID